MWIDRGLIGSPWMSKTVGRDPDAADREPGLPGRVRFSERGPGGQATLHGSPGEHKAGKTRARRRSDGKGSERSGRGGDLVNEHDEDRRIRSRRSVPADGRRYGRRARAAGEPASQAPGDRDGAQRHQGGYEEGGGGQERELPDVPGGELGAEGSRYLTRVAELAHGSLCGGDLRQARTTVGVGGVEQAAAQFSHNIAAGPGRAGQRGSDLGEVGLDHLAAGHGITGRAAGSSKAVTAAEKSRQAPRSAARVRQPAAVSW